MVILEAALAALGDPKTFERLGEYLDMSDSQLTEAVKVAASRLAGLRRYPRRHEWPVAIRHMAAVQANAQREGLVCHG